MEKLPTDEHTLPKVLMDVFGVVQSEMRKSGDERGWYVDIAREIKQTNPLIFEVMIHFSQEAMEAEDNGRCHDLVNKAVLLTYRLLQTQADVCQLSNEFLIDEVEAGDDKDGTR